MLFAVARAAPLALPMPTWDTPLPAPIAETLADAQTIGIGESVHLSAGLEQVRSWVTYRLVVEQELRLVAVELSWDEGLRVDASLQACRTGPWEEPAVTDPFWSAYAPLNLRLCQWNQGHPDDPVHLIGVDVQDAWNHLARLDARPALQACHGTQATSKAALATWAREHGFPAPTEQQERACLAALAPELDHADPDRRLAAVSMLATMRSARALLAHKDATAAYDLREAAMLQALDRGRQRFDTARYVVLAHDGHVARTPSTYHPLGARLAERGRYLAIAVTAGRASSRLSGAGVVRHPIEGLPTSPLVWTAPDPRGHHDALLYLPSSPATDPGDPQR